jgi:hypothetical protein
MKIQLSFNNAPTATVFLHHNLASVFNDWTQSLLSLVHVINLYIIAVRHHIAGMELLLSSRYMVPLRCSYGCDSREEEYLVLREFIRVWIMWHTGELTGLLKKNTVTWAIPGTETYTPHWATPRTEVYNYIGQLQGPKFCTLLRMLPVTEVPLEKKLPLQKLVLLPPHFKIIPKSSDLVLIFPCLFPTFLGRMFSRAYGNGLHGSFPSEIPFQGSTFRLTSARLLGDSISAWTKQNRISY